MIFGFRNPLSYQVGSLFGTQPDNLLVHTVHTVRDSATSPLNMIVPLYSHKTARFWDGNLKTRAEKKVSSHFY